MRDYDFTKLWQVCFISDLYWCLLGLNLILNDFSKPFQAIGSLRTEFAASVSCSSSPPRPPGPPQHYFNAFLMFSYLNPPYRSTFNPITYLQGSAFGLQRTPGLASRVKKNWKKFKKYKILGRIWHGLGVLRGWFGSIFGTISDRLWKIENLRAQNWKSKLEMTSNTPKNQ